jgi:hypothetical protein
MASRSGPGAGVYITVTVLGVLTLTLFALTIVFASKYQNAHALATDANREVASFITRPERTNDEILRLRSVAQSNNQSAMAYLKESYDANTARITGVPSDTPDDVNTKLAANGVKGSQPLLQVLSDRDRQIRQLTQSNQEAQDALARAREDLRAEVEKSQNRESIFTETVDALNASVERYKTDADAHRQALNDYRAQLVQHEEDLKNDQANQISALRSQLQGKDTEIITLQRQLDDWRSRAGNESLSPNDEYALVDGAVIGLNTAQDYVYISLGSQDKIQLGMTFSVYGQAADIRPDAAGNYPRPNAGIEVIEIDESHATCRVIPGTQRLGNPIIVGNVIANPIYDPNKVYKFVVFGDFDANGDGSPTSAEAGTISNVIRQWGGEVIDELAGDVDFLVLGLKPALPIAPQPDSPIDVFRAYTAKKRAADRYDKLWSDAIKTRIPVLNMNRLYTLTGKPFGYIR